MKISSGVVALSVLILSGCGGGGCDDNVEPGVAVRVFDSETGEPLCGVSGIITGDDYHEEIHSLESGCIESRGFMSGADEREGSYQLILSKDGYEVWTSDTLDVTGGRCHVSGHDFDVMLKKEL